MKIARVLLSLSTAVLLNGMAAGAQADDVVFRQEGVTVKLKRGVMTVDRPGKPQRQVTGDIATFDGTDSYADLARDVIVAQSNGGTLCPGGLWTVIDLRSMRGKNIDAPCGETVAVKVDGSADKPIAVVLDGKRAVRKVAIR